MDICLLLCQGGFSGDRHWERGVQDVGSRLTSVREEREQGCMPGKLNSEGGIIAMSPTLQRALEWVLTVQNAPFLLSPSTFTLRNHPILVALGRAWPQESGFLDAEADHEGTVTGDCLLSTHPEGRQ